MLSKNLVVLLCYALVINPAYATDGCFETRDGMIRDGSAPDIEVEVSHKTFPEVVKSIYNSNFVKQPIFATEMALRLYTGPLYLVVDAAAFPFEYINWRLKARSARIKNEINQLKGMPGPPFKKVFLQKSKLLKVILPLLLFSILYVFGVAPHQLLLDNATYLEDMQKNFKTYENLKDHELIVFVASAEPFQQKQMDREHLAAIQRAEKAGIKNAASRFVRLDAHTAEQMLIQLKSLRAQGRIKELHIAAHGQSGGFDLSTSVEKFPKIFGKSTGFVDKNLFENYEALTKDWPEDLFAEDARIYLHSCSVACGVKGKEFMSKFGSDMAHHGVTVYASPNVYFGYTEDSIKEKSGLQYKIETYSKLDVLEKAGVSKGKKAAYLKDMFRAEVLNMLGILYNEVNIRATYGFKNPPPIIKVRVPAHIDPKQ